MVSLLFSFFFMILGSIDIFIGFLEKVGFYIESRAFSFALRMLGCSGGLASAMIFMVKAVGEDDFYSCNESGDSSSSPSSVACEKDDSKSPAADEKAKGYDSSSSSEAQPGPAEPGQPSAKSSKEPSALQERAEELLLENLQERKAALVEGEPIAEVREAVENDLKVTDKVKEFQLIQDLQKEQNLNPNCPGTKSALNEIKDFSGRAQDWKGTRGRIDENDKKKKDAATGELNFTFLTIFAGLTQGQQFILLVLSLFCTFIIIMTLLIYIHLLFRTYSAIVKDALEWNKKFWKPIKFSYSWLQGVVISVQVESACVGNEEGERKSSRC